MRRSTRPGTCWSSASIFVGDFAIAGDVCAFDLDVDGRGQAEVEDLGDDIGGQEVEGDAGEFAGKSFAQRRRRSRRWGEWFFFEGDQDVGVAGAEEAGGGVLQCSCVL